jgi:hypothetical protein
MLEVSKNADEASVDYSRKTKVHFSVSSMLLAPLLFHSIE